MILQAASEVLNISKDTGVYMTWGVIFSIAAGIASLVATWIKLGNRVQKVTTDQALINQDIRNDLNTYNSLTDQKLEEVKSSNENVSDKIDSLTVLVTNMDKKLSVEIANREKTNG